MHVRSLVPHFSTDGALHERGNEYELEGDELSFRLKDAIVCDASIPEIVPAPPPPPPTREELDAAEHRAAIDAAVASTPLADPEE